MRTAVTTLADASSGAAHWKARQLTFNAHAGSRVSSGRDSREQSRQPPTPKCSVFLCSQQIEHGLHHHKQQGPCVPELCPSHALRIRYPEDSGASWRHSGCRVMEVAGEITRARHEWTSCVTALAQRGMKSIVTLNGLVTHAGVSRDALVCVKTRDVTLTRVSLAANPQPSSELGQGHGQGQGQRHAQG